MSDEARYRGGWLIANVLARLGWLAATCGIALAAYSAIFVAEASVVARIAAAVPGGILFLLGLIATSVAHLTRAAIDVATALREMAEETRNRAGAAMVPLRNAASSPATKSAPIAEPPLQTARIQMPPRRRGPELTRPPRRDGSESNVGATSVAETETPNGQTARPKLMAVTDREVSKVRPLPNHPIFSAKPPR